MQQITQMEIAFLYCFYLYFLILFLIQFNQSMSLRKVKLLLQKKKEIQQKQQIKQQQQIVEKPKKVNSFAAFVGDDSDDDRAQQLQNEKKQTRQQDYQQEKEKKKKKKKKNKNKNKEDQQSKELRELQESLKELKSNQKQNSEEQDNVQEEWAYILSINQSKFNYQKQLRRHFKGWQPEKGEGDPDLSKKQQKMQKHMKKLMKKSVLSPGIGQYFPIRQKFEIQRLEDGGIRFRATKKYDSLQRQYEIIRNGNDINALFQFTQFNPQHVDSLYAVGQFLRLKGNYRDADNLIQRVIYIYQMAGGYDIGQFLKQPFIKKFIIYDVTSTSFFMSIFKFMDILGKKGCYKAALQYNKFLLKINVNDPTACMLCLDYNAISSKNYQFLTNFINNFSNYIGCKNASIYLMPNFTYSLGLAKFLNIAEPPNASELVVENIKIYQQIQFTNEHWQKALILPANHSYVTQDARVLILRAIMVYPKLIIDIAAKNQYAKQFLNHQSYQGWQKKSYQQILNHQFWTVVPSSYSYYFLKLQNVDDSIGLDKVLQVYVERSKILWKSNNVMLWVKGALGFVLNKVQEKFDYQTYLQNLCLEDTKIIQIPFNLRRYTTINKNNFSDRVERIDLNNIQDNQQIRQVPQGQQLNMNQNPFSLFLNSLLPWVNIPGAQVQQPQNDPDMPFIQQDQN